MLLTVADLREGTSSTACCMNRDPLQTIAFSYVNVALHLNIEYLAPFYYMAFHYLDSRQVCQ